MHQTAFLRECKGKKNALIAKVKNQTCWTLNQTDINNWYARKEVRESWPH